MERCRVELYHYDQERGGATFRAPDDDTTFVTISEARWKQMGRPHKINLQLTKGV